MDDIRRELVAHPGRGPVYLHCPAHNDQGRPNLAVYANGTYCFRCGFKETAEAFLDRIRAHPEQARVPRQYRYRPRSRSYQEPDWPQLVKQWHRELVSGSRKERLTYLFQERCLAGRIIGEQQLGHTGSRFVIPYWEHGKVVGVKFRSDPLYPDDDGKYQNSPGLSALFDPCPDGSPVVVTEGEFDALVLAQYGVRAVTAHNGSQGMIQKILHTKLPWSGVIIATDWDEPGEESAQLLLAARPRWIRPRRPWSGPGKDLTDWVRTMEPARRGTQLRRWLQQVRGG